MQPKPINKFKGEADKFKEDNLHQELLNRILQGWEIPKSSKIPGEAEGEGLKDHPALLRMFFSPSHGILGLGGQS